MIKNKYIEKIGKKAKLASLNLLKINVNKRNSVLKEFSKNLKVHSKSIINANKKDIYYARSQKISIQHHLINKLQI